jgi:hypothetical protein
VQEVKRITKLAVVALLVGVVGAVLARLKRPPAAPSAPPDERTEELRRKLAEARAAAADQDEFEAAGMGAETIVDEPPRAAPGEPERPVDEQEAVAERAPEKKEPSPPASPSPSEPPPQDEFEAMRRRIHQEGKAAAEEMRRSADPPEKP